jgi:hypothetical protein
VALSNHSGDVYDFRQYQFIDTTPLKMPEVALNMYCCSQPTPLQKPEIALRMYYDPPPPLRFPLLEMHTDLALFNCFERDCAEENKCYYQNETCTWVAPNTIDEGKRIRPDKSLPIVSY